MTTPMNQTPIENLRKSEDEARSRAEVARQGIEQLEHQANKTRIIDDQIQLKTNATQLALREVKKKTETARKAEAEAQEAANHVEKAEAELKAAKAYAEKLYADTKEAEEVAKQKKTEAEGGQNDQTLKQAAEEAEKAAKEKRELADRAKITAENPEKNQKIAELRQKEEELLIASRKARDEESAAVNALKKAREEEELFRSKLQSTSSSRWQSFLAKISPLMTPESLIGASLLVLGAIGLTWITGAIFNVDFLVKLKDVNVARGLITLLVALSVVIIAMIVTLYATVSTDKEFLKEKFGYGKEIFTAFVGILGTIIGFYFASDHSSAGATETPPQFLSFDPSEGHPGDKIKFTTLMYSGNPPFNWEISSIPEGIMGQGSDSDSYIEAQVIIPERLPYGIQSLEKGYDIKLKVTDSDNKVIAEPRGKLKVNSPPELELLADPKEVKAGDTFTLKSNASLGEGFSYEIYFNPEIMPKITGIAETSGQIQSIVEIPGTAPAGDYNMVLKVTDSSGKILEEKKGKFVITRQ
jgi:chemotaxis protein histidine kinase CheA